VVEFEPATLSDGLGSTMAMVDGSGNVVMSYAYDVYGKVTSSSGSVANKFDFAGQQTDPTGLQYLRALCLDDRVSPRVGPITMSGSCASLMPTRPQGDGGGGRSQSSMSSGAKGAVRAMKPN